MFQVFRVLGAAKGREQNGLSRNTFWRVISLNGAFSAYVARCKENPPLILQTNRSKFRQRKSLDPSTADPIQLILNTMWVLGKWEPDTKKIGWI